MTDNNRQSLWLPAGLIVLVCVAGYWNTLHCPFIFDDANSIVDNPAIRRLPPANLADWFADMRPVVNLTLAVNYRLGGLDVTGYHAFNLLVHVLAALTLFGVVRRTILIHGAAGLPSRRDNSSKMGTFNFSQTTTARKVESPHFATGLALAVAAIWAAHPLQTEAVTYTIQRAEAMAGLFYLLTLYCFIRGVAWRPLSAAMSSAAWRETTPAMPPGRWWLVAAVLSCALGMGSKQIAVTAPLVVLLYDRTFLAGSFSAALRRRWPLYAGLAATWGILAAMLLTVPLGRTAGAELASFTWWSYPLTQFGVIAHYLRLAFWPAGLCFDYGWQPVTDPTEAILPGLLVLALVGLSVAALVVRTSGRVRSVPVRAYEGDERLTASLRAVARALGFCGAWVFLILAPTSSVIPINDAAVEHRMYLPLAGVVAAVVIAAYAGLPVLLSRLPLAGMAAAGAVAAVGGGAELPAVAPALGRLQAKSSEGMSEPSSVPRRRFLAIIAAFVVVAVLLSATHARNLDYQSELAIWRDAAKKCPNNPRARNNYGEELRRQASALAAAALARPDLRSKAEAAMRPALAEFDAAIAESRTYSPAWCDRGIALAQLGENQKALDSLNEAVRLKADYAQAYLNRGNIYLQLAETRPLDRGANMARAIEDYDRAIAIRPGYADAYRNRAACYLSKGDYGRAWDDVKACRQAGGVVPPGLVEALKAASGRAE